MSVKASNIMRGTEYKETITADMISTKCIDFTTEEEKINKYYKANLLEERYNNWKKTYSNLSNGRKNILMCKKKMDRIYHPAALEDQHSHVRWIKCISEGKITFIKNSAVLIGSGYFILIYDISSNVWKQYCTSSVDSMEGIGCLDGSRDEELFSYSEKCQRGRIMILNYPDLETVHILKDKYDGKVMGLGFSDNETLISLKCSFSEHRIVIWSWRSSTMIFSFVCEKSYLHPDLFTTSLDHPKCAMVAYDRLKQIVQFWNINFCGEETVLINRRSSTINIDGVEIHDIVFNNGVLYLIDACGHIYNYIYSKGKINLLISWIHFYTPVQDFKEIPYSPERLVNKTKAFPDLNDEDEYDPDFVSEDEGYEPPEPENINIPEYSYTEYPSDVYEEGEEEEEEENSDYTSSSEKSNHKCHMIWYKSGIVASGPDGRVKFYTQDQMNDQWIKRWGLIPAGVITKFVTNQNQDILMGWSERYGLIRIKPGEGSSQVIQFFGSKIRSMCLLHPLDSFLLTLSSLPELCLWKKKSGRLLNIVKLNCEMNKILCHHNSPLVVLNAKSEGTLYGIDFSNPRASKSWSPLRLVRKPFSSISFLQNTDILFACLSSKDEFILVKVTLERGFEVYSSLKCHHKLINLIAIQADDNVRRGIVLFNGVPKGSEPVPDGYIAGKLLDMLRFPSMIVEKTWASSNFYRAISCGPGIGHILAIPADLKWEVHSYVISLKKAGGWKYLGCIRVGHQVGTFEMNLYDHHFMTYGFDGIVSCFVTLEMFDKNSGPYCTIFPHHRFDMGINEAVIDFRGQYIITKGHDGLIVCSRIKMRYRCKHPFHVSKLLPKRQLDVTHFQYVEEYGEIFWEEISRRKQSKTEKVLSEGRVVRIKEEFEKIKELWEEYYTENKAETPENRIPDNDFELNKDRLENLIALTERDTTASLTFLSSSLQKSKKWIDIWKNNCWDKMAVKLYRLKPFVARFCLENFNQSKIPPQMATYHELLAIASKLDAAIFPLHSPKMLPWYQLDNDEEFPEFKLQKYPDEPKALEDEDIQQGAIDLEIDENENESVHEQEVNEQGLLEEEGEEEEGQEIFKYCLSEGDEASRDDDSGLLSPSSEVLDKVQVFQDKIQKEILSKGQVSSKEASKILFQELEKLRQFNAKHLHPKKAVLEEEEDDEQFENWKRMYIKKYGLNKKKPKELEEEAEEEEASEELFQEYNIQYREGKETKDENEELLGKEEHSEDENIELNLETEEDVKKLAQLNEERNAELIEKKQSRDELPKDDSSVDSVSFSWSDVELGCMAPKYRPVFDSEEHKKETRMQLQKKDYEVLEFGDLPREEKIIEEKCPEDPLDEPYSMNGAQSLRFANVDYGRCNEFSLNGIFTTDIQVSCLQKTLETLGQSFNKIFYEIHKRKEDDLAALKAKHSSLVKHIDDFVNVCKGYAIEPPRSYDWSKSEMPDWIWEEPYDKELPVEPFPLVKGYAVDTNEEDKIEEDPFKKQCLQEMMGGVLEVTWQEEVQEELEMPKFLLEKDPDEYNEENIAEVEKYLRIKQEREDKLQYHKNLAEKEIKKLFSQVEQIVNNFDMELLNSAKMKMKIDSCMQCELLKITRMKQKALIADRTLEKIRSLKGMIGAFHSEGMKLSAMSRLFLRKTALLHSEVDKFNTKQKTIETDFFSRIEHFKLSKKAVESLRALIKKKPVIQMENKVYPTELLSIARSVAKCQYPPYFSIATQSFFDSLTKLDSSENCPPNVDATVWGILVEFRQLKIIADLMSKANLLLAVEAEKTALLYYRHFVSHLQRFDKIKCCVRDERIRLEHHCNKMDFQLVLPDGFVESHQTGNLEDFKDCIYVSKKYIDNLNNEIIELQKKKEIRWKDFDKYMRVVNNAELLHKELRLRIRIKENILRDVKSTKINKYTKDFLSEYHRRHHPNYGVKLYDQLKQDKIKEMVKKYFEKYYRMIKGVKDADDEKKKWAKNTIVLRATNEQLSSETQDLNDLVDKMDTQAIEKPLHDRNEAIMLHGKLKRQMEANEKELEALEAELADLYKRTYISFN